MNAKIGGQPWAVSKLPFMDKPTMIVGYDVHHKRGQPSLVAVNASINSNANKYWSKVIEQETANDETIRSMQQIVKEAMEAFKASVKVYPEQVIFYRDGVGESQKQVIMKLEINDIKAAFENMGLQTKFLFIMVNKRVKTKFVSVNPQNGKLFNPQPGTVLDHTVTPHDLYDFFLVSQNVRQGIPTPSHYSVLYDSIKGSVEDIQRLTYDLCHLYYNFSGPVKIPAPVKYADKLAHMCGERGRNVIPSTKFSETNGLYFI